MTKPKQTTPGAITGAAKKVTARMLTDLWAATDDSLDRFRKTRRPGANTWELEHLRQVRDLLDLLGYALKTNDADAWAQVDAAWQRVQEPIENGAPPPQEGTAEEPSTSADPAKPAVADPAPKVAPLQPASPGMDAPRGAPKPAPPPMPSQPGEGGIPLGVKQPLRPLPKVEDRNLTFTPELLGQGPALPFTEPKDPPPIEQLPAPAPEEWEPEEFDYAESGTAVGFSLEDVGPALPFRGEGGAAGSEDAGPTEVDESDDDGSYDATSVAVLRTAPTDPALLQQVIGDADETMQLDAPSEQEPSQSPPAAAVEPASKTAPEPERDASTTEYETLTTLPGHMPPSLAHLHQVSVEQYAYLVAECEAFPDRAQAARSKLGLRDEYEQSVLDEIFNGRFSQDPTTRSQWEQLRVSYRAWLESGQSK
ncbi:MAG: hypothetical protein JRI68_10280 [Deltaproteobacteria bacterium]|nr:hypothetical protein [Deltaproteobacteria bacterium]